MVFRDCDYQLQSVLTDFSQERTSQPAPTLPNSVFYIGGLLLIPRSAQMYIPLAEGDSEIPKYSNSEIPKFCLGLGSDFSSNTWHLKPYRAEI